MVLTRIDGVESADVSYEAGRAVITYDPALTSPEQFLPELEEMTGYRAELIAPPQVDRVHPPASRDGNDGHGHDSTHAH